MATMTIPAPTTVESSFLHYMTQVYTPACVLTSTSSDSYEDTLIKFQRMAFYCGAMAFLRLMSESLSEGDEITLADEHNMEVITQELEDYASKTLGSIQGGHL